MAKRLRNKEKNQSRTSPADPPEGEGAEGGDDMARIVGQHGRESQDHLTKWREEAAESYDFAAGVQWTEDEVSILKDQLRPVITFNRVAPVLDAVSGYEINSRQDVTYLPRTIDDTGPAQVESAAAKFFREACDAEDEESDMFYDALVCGMGWSDHRIDFDDDPEGMLDVDRIDPMEMGYDPASIRRNLADARYVLRGRWMDRKRAEEMWPDHDFKSADTMRNPRDDGDVNEPIKVPQNAWYKDNAVGSQYERRRGKVFILEQQYFEREAFYSAINPGTGKMEDMTGSAHSKLQKQLKEIGQPPLESQKRTKKVFKRAFVHGPTTLEDEPAPCPEMFSYQCITGKRDRNRNHWYGLVRPMKDPQRWANKWLSQQLHLINSNAKGRMFHERGVFDNIATVEKKMANPGATIEVNEGMLDKMRVEQPVQLPNNSFQLMEYAIASVRDTTGVNVELLGMADRNQPGILEQQRKQSAMAILAPLFDAQRRYRKNAGRLTLYFIHEYLSDGRLIRIVGDEGAKYVPLTKAEGFDEYDVIVDESPSSTNQKEAVFGVMMQIMPGLQKAGVPIPPEVLDYVPGLPAALAEKWKALLTKPNPEGEIRKILEGLKVTSEVDKNVAIARKNDADAQAAGMMAPINSAQAIMQIMQAFQAAGQPIQQQQPPMGQPGMPPGQPPMQPEQQMPMPPGPQGMQ